MISDQISRSAEVLLVEDSSSDAKLIIRQLQQGKAAHRLTWLEDGESALAYFRREGQYRQAARPDLILLDLNLPGMDGRDVLHAVKTDADLKVIPIVILTTSGAEADILSAYQMSANCCITKPVDIQQFIQVIRLIRDMWLTTAVLPPWNDGLQHSKRR